MGCVQSNRKVAARYATASRSSVSSLEELRNGTTSQEDEMDSHQGEVLIAAVSIPSTGTMITVVTGRIEHQGGADTVIVNAANEDLKLGRGVAGALKKACGEADLQRECNLFKAEMSKDVKIAPVPTGSVAVTGAYKMAPTRAIIHAVAPMCDPPGVRTADQASQLRAAYDCVMEASKQLSAKIVVIPFLGAGIFKYPEEESAELALLSALAHCPSSTIVEIRFVCTEPRITRNVERLLGGVSVTVNTVADVSRIVGRISQRSQSISGNPSNMNMIRSCLQFSLNFRLWQSRVSRVLAESASPAATLPAASSAATPSKRRGTPNPPGAAKRVPPVSLSPPTPASQLPSQRGAFTSLSQREYTERMRRETAEESQTRKDKEAERMRRLRRTSKEIKERHQQESADARSRESTQQTTQRKEIERRRSADARAQREDRREDDRERLAKRRAEEASQRSQGARTQETPSSATHSKRRATPNSPGTEKRGFTDREDLFGENQQEEEMEEQPARDDGDESEVSDGNEDHLHYPDAGEEVPRTVSPVDFGYLSDAEEDVYAADPEAEQHIEGQEYDEAILADPRSLLVEEPDDEPEYVQRDVGFADQSVQKWTDKEQKRLHPSRRQHYLYLLQERRKGASDPNLRINLLGGINRLLSQFIIIDQFMRMVRARNDYLRGTFAEFRGSTVRQLTVAHAILTARAEKRKLNAGYTFRLPRIFPGSVAWYNDQFDKSIAVLMKVGKPDLFVTFTGNPEWEEIQKNKIPNTDWQSNAMLVCSVFYKKCQELLDDIVNKELFGPVVGFVYSIEFQKRGMPHMHLLVINKPGFKMDREETIEKHVFARFPEISVLKPDASTQEKKKKQLHEELLASMKQFNIHAPCKHNNRAYCQKHPNRNPNVAYPRCTKNFPKPLSEFTKIMPDGQVVYFRPASTYTMAKDSRGNRTEVFNDWVVTYSPYVTQKYQSHCNVEVVSGNHVFKYLFKYIFKGFDKALMEVYAQFDNEANQQVGNGGMTVTDQGAMLPDAAAKNREKAKAAAKRMQAEAEKMGVENAGDGVLVNFDEAIIKETFRQTTACEAAWSILGLPLAGRSHEVKLLTVHEPGEQPIVFKKGEEEGAIRQIEEGEVVSMLMAYMKLMDRRAKAREYRSRKKQSADPSQAATMPGFAPASTLNVPVADGSQAASLATAIAPDSPVPSAASSASGDEPTWGRDDEDYDVSEDGAFRLPDPPGMDTSRGPTFEEIATTHHFVRKTQEWVKYERQPKLIVFIRPVNVRKPERFAIREIVRHVGGITSFEDMRTVNGVVYGTFVEAAYARGLMNSQKEYEDLLRDAIQRESPYVVRRMFVDCIVHGALLYPQQIWENEDFWKKMIDPNYTFRANEARVMKGKIAALYHIECMLKRNNYTLEQVNLAYDTLPNGRVANPHHALNDAELRTAQDVLPTPGFATLGTLTEEQNEVKTTVCNAVERGESKIFFLQASGGCGKTFLYRAIDAELRRKDRRVVNVASTGIASILLRNGSTAHRQFFLPMNMTEGTLSSMTMESAPAKWLEGAHLIIFDEATMADRFIFNAIDVLLRNIMDRDEPFGGKVMLLGGDWKQLLPVVTARSAEIACDVLTLKKNMRASRDDEFAKFLEETGVGRFNGRELPYVQINKPGVMMPSQAAVLQAIYEGKLEDEEYIYRSCVLCTTNKHAEYVNSVVLAHVSGPERVYCAIDTPSEGLTRQAMPETFKDNMESGMPPYELHLKVGAIVILLRNLNLQAGMCNGTRLVVDAMHDKYIVVRQLDPRWMGQKHEILRKEISPPETPGQKPLYTRFQFPLRLAYCLTINKSQGQTFERVGVLLQNNVFAHGQLYVALSRVHSFSNLKIFSRAKVRGVEGVVLANEVSRSIIGEMNKAIAKARPHPAIPTAATQLPPTPPPEVTGEPPAHMADLVLEASRRARGIGPLLPVQPLHGQPTLDRFFADTRTTVVRAPPQVEEEMENVHGQPSQRVPRPTVIRGPLPVGTGVRRTVCPPAPFVPTRQPEFSQPTQPVPTLHLSSLVRRPTPHSPAHPVTSDDVVQLPPPLLLPAQPPAPTNWLRLANSGSDCFLNAAIQLLRRARILAETLEDTKPIWEDDSVQSQAMRMLLNFLKMDGTSDVTELRQLLPEIIRFPNDDFTTSQQDSMEAVLKMFEIMPEFSTLFKVTLSSMGKCRGVDTCQWHDMAVESGTPHIVNVNRDNEVINLEEVLSSADRPETEEQEPWHCGTCCTHCDHVSRCACSNKQRPYIKKESLRFDGSSDYVLISMSILQRARRYDWQLDDSNNLDSMNILDARWQAVAVIQHIGQAGENWSSGHYVAFTRELDGAWWRHNDDKDPEQRDPPSRNMTGIVGILFQKKSPN